MVSVNPGSLLNTNMVMEAFGSARGEVDVGVDILMRAAFSDEFQSAGGDYYDNDIHQFSVPHSDVMDMEKCEAVVREIEAVLAKFN